MADRKPPNFLIFLPDQQRGDALGCAGNPHIRTPMLDRMAADGAYFPMAHTNNPICIPARATLISGAWGLQTGILANQGVPTGCLPEKFVTLPQILSRAGYFCQAIGKMHYVPPRNHYGFHRMQLMEEVPPWRHDDEYLMYLEKVGYGHVREVHGVRRELYMQPQVSLLPAEHHGTNWVADRTIDFLRANADRPFMGLCGWIAPHPPWNIPESLAHEYDPDLLPLPNRRDEELTGQNEFVKRQENAMELDGASDSKLRLIKALYYTAVTMIDSAIGRILACLDELGLSDNTMVIFTGDHGEMLGDHWSWQKKLFYQASANIPLIVRYPRGINAGTVCSELVNTTDILPTILDAAGLDYPGQIELPGHSLLELIDGRISGRDVLFGETQHGGASLMFMARTKRYKYVYTVRGGYEELYDLQDDPDEFCNLAGRPEVRDIRNDLRSRLTGWLQHHRFEPALDGSDLKATPADPPLVDRHNRQDALWPANLDPARAAEVQSAEASLKAVSDRTYEVLGVRPLDP